LQTPGTESFTVVPIQYAAFHGFEQLVTLMLLQGCPPDVSSVWAHLSILLFRSIAHNYLPLSCECNLTGAAVCCNNRVISRPREDCAAAVAKRGICELSGM